MTINRPGFGIPVFAAFTFSRCIVNHENSGGNDLTETARNRETRMVARARTRTAMIGGKGGRKKTRVAEEGENSAGPNEILIKFHNLETTLSRALCTDLSFRHAVGCNGDSFSPALAEYRECTACASRCNRLPHFFSFSLSLLLAIAFAS